MRAAVWPEWGGLCRRQVGGAGLDVGGALTPSLGAAGRGAVCAVACLWQSTGSPGEIGQWERPESTRVAAGLTGQ